MKRSSDATILKAYFGAAAILTGLTVLASLGVAHADALRAQILPLSSFEPSALAMLFVVGAIATTTRRPGGQVTRLLEKHERKSVLTFATGAGAIAGWGIGASLAFLATVGLTALPKVLIVFGYVLLLGLAPLWIHEQLVPFAQSYKEPTNLDRPHPSRLRLIGLCMMIIAGVGLATWGTTR